MQTSGKKTENRPDNAIDGGPDKHGAGDLQPKNNIVAKDQEMSNEVANQGLLSVIEKAANNPEVDVQKVQALLDMQLQVMDKQAEISFNNAMTRLQSKMPRIKRGRAVEYAIDKTKPDGPKKTAFKFSAYEDIDKDIRPLLDEEGFSMSFTSEMRSGDGGGIIVHGTLSHKDGHSRTASIPIALDTTGGKNNIQAMGSSFSYGKRYTLTMLLNIVTEGEDDDGNTQLIKAVTEEQRDELQKLIEETETDIAAFCKQYDIQSLADLNAKEFRAAKILLKAKKEKKDKE